MGFGIANMPIALDKGKIDTANSHSHFEAGDGIVRDAQVAYQEFFSEFDLDDCHSDEQREYLEDRAVQWRGLITSGYSEILYGRASFVPVHVAGPANYNSKKFDKIAERNFRKSAEFQEKIGRFIANTKAELRRLRPLEITLEGLEKGRYFDEPIMSDDPHALLKLEAKLKHLVNFQTTMKERNAYFRKHETMVGCPNLTE